MTNTFTPETMLWIINETAALTDASTIASHFKSPIIRKIIFFPGAAGDALTFQTGDSKNAILLRAGATDTSPIHVDFGERGKRIPGIKVSTVGGGVAYVYLA